LRLECITKGVEVMERLEQIFTIVTDECLRRKINYKHIECGCEYAERVFKETGSFSACILNGIAVAEGEQKREDYYKYA
jgi:hypothetical protein